MRTSRKMRAVAHSAILAIALSAGSAAIGPVFASPAMATQVLPGVINFAKTDSSLTIHKREGVAGETRDNGLVNNNPGGKPLQGVTYQVALVKPITNAAQFSEAAKLRYPKDKAAIDQAVANENKKVTQVTGPTGEANFQNLKLGLYLVTETNAPADVHRAQPFLVMLPMTSPDNNNAWNYNLHVYPKNQRQPKPVKEVIDAEVNAGHKLTYTISNVLPDLPTSAGGGYQSLIIWDDIDETQLSVVADDVTVAVAGTTKALAKGVDYRVDVDARYSPPSGSAGWQNGQKVVRIEFDQIGLSKLTEAYRAAPGQAKVVATIKATAKATRTPLVENEAVVYVDNGAGGGFGAIPTPGAGVNNPTQPPVGTKTDKVTTIFGNVKVIKHEAGKENIKIPDTTFELYRCTGSAESPVLAGNKLTVGGKTSWTTQGSQGEVEIQGLHVTDFENGAPVSSPSKKYCLVETKANAKYELSPQPIQFDLRSEQVRTKMTQDLKVPNLLKTTPNLPLTGGAGVTLLGLLGLAIIGIGAWFARRNTVTA
ncbi:fimbrial isopeptide formation D2 domain [Corynebacterium mustelae]|uniref:Fimbrial isopeptide formation D2 domain n=1 Tax=Corynebacterium mustelae TaxID=571915 RepID=A0A0G3GY18_9CORY|nr:SpaH/EbpB family LPXTG-anchored major pilin [Corynebacterium mustelae]AKK04438.1 fimbrial isopeptide formation D2 domain [Corynebacterium mustelae]